jgi:Tfp pilus assembly protein PilX
MFNTPYKNSVRTNAEAGNSGYALVTAMIMTAIIAAIVGSSLTYVGTEMRLTRDSSARVQAIHSAEAGVELALEAFHSSLTGANGWDGWTSSGDTYTLTVTNLTSGQASSLTDGVLVTANTNTLIVTATGRVFSTSLNSDVIRSIQVELEKTTYHPYQTGMLGKDQVQMTGNSFMDSFDSSDPTKSTGGAYDAAKSQANLTVGSMSTNSSGAISGGGNSTVKGDLQTAPGGGLQSGGNFLYTGTLSDDLDVDIPDVTVPWTLSPPFSAALDVSRQAPVTIPITGDTDLEFLDISVENGATLTLTGNGKLRIYTDGSLFIKTGGMLTIDNSTPGNDLQVEIYANGYTHINGLALGSGLAEDFAILGTTNCTHVQYSGKSDFIGTVYAPTAAFHLSGQGGMVGAVVADEIKMTGQGDFHYDEVLGNITSADAGNYDVISWIEL